MVMIFFEKFVMAHIEAVENKISIELLQERKFKIY